MCFVLYLGSDLPRPLIDWDESQPRFHVKADDADAQIASKHFSKRNVYYVGSNEGCGCGFRQEFDVMIEDAAELAKHSENQAQLHGYVKQCLEDEKTIELYGCWSGDESLSLEHERSITVEELLQDDFWFAERQRTIVTRAG